MNKKKSFLGLYLIITFVIIISAVVVSLTLGINLGSDIGGGTQFEVAIDGNVASNKDINKIKDIVKDNGEVVETIFVEDKLTETVIVVRIADKKIEKQLEIKNAIIEKLDLEETAVSSFDIFGGTITNKAVLYAGIAMACILLFMFVAGWIRYQMVAGLSLVFTVLHTLMLMISLLILTRIPLTIISLMIMLSLIAVVMFASVLLLEKIKANSKLKHYESLSAKELVKVSVASVIRPLVFLAILTLAISIVMVCIPVRYVALSACAMLVCLFAVAYSLCLIGIPMHEKLLDLKVQADKLRLSKNSSPAPSKNKAKKENV